MAVWELFFIAVGLSMDAFAVSVCKGLSMQKMCWKNAWLAGVYFGGFQMLMPLAGYLLGTGFQDKITSIDHWIAFILLGAIGANMIKESFSGEAEGDCSFDVKTMLLLAVATSIDALAVGVTVRAVGGGRAGGKRVWQQVQVEGGACGGSDFDFYGNENPAGALGRVLRLCIPGDGRLAE